jgi:hypothetical protein
MPDDSRALRYNPERTTVGFSGTRLSIRARPQADAIIDILKKVSTFRGFVTGACVGVDALVGESLIDEYPEKWHLVIVPADRSRIVAWWRQFPNHPTLRVHEMPPGTDYADRNFQIVAASSQLVAFPGFAEDDERSRRSGTWQTIRMARRIHSNQPLVKILSEVQ